MWLIRSTGTPILLMLLMLAGCASAEESAFLEAEKAWRAERDASMRAEDSWLTIAGLFWLAEGEQTFGSGVGSDIRLPVGSSPERAGSFIRSERLVTVRPAPGAGVLLEGEPAGERPMRSDAGGRPDRLQLGELRMWVIERGDRVGIRLRDLREPRYLEYPGLDFYPPDPAYRLPARFIPYEEPVHHRVSTVVGTTVEMASPGRVSFTLHGRDLTLEAFEGPDERTLYFVFSDATSGEETYGAGRFLYATLSENGEVDLNFNRAHNPPCAYTPFATCPLPLAENVLPVPVAAGEKIYPGAH